MRVEASSPLRPREAALASRFLLALVPLIDLETLVSPSGRQQGGFAYMATATFEETVIDTCYRLETTSGNPDLYRRR